MAKRVLAIGVGGSGKSALTILKERLEETYGQVPDNVVLLSLDTDSSLDVDRFAGARLNPTYESNRNPKFQQIVSFGGIGKTASAYRSITEAIGRTYSEPKSAVVFVVASVAGGTGSGMLVDVTALFRLPWKLSYRPYVVERAGQPMDHVYDCVSRFTEGRMAHYEAKPTNILLPPVKCKCKCDLARWVEDAHEPKLRDRSDVWSERRLTYTALGTISVTDLRSETQAVSTIPDHSSSGLKRLEDSRSTWRETVDRQASRLRTSEDTSVVVKHRNAHLAQQARGDRVQELLQEAAEALASGCCKEAWVLLRKAEQEIEQRVTVELLDAYLEPAQQARVNQVRELLQEAAEAMANEYFDEAFALLQDRVAAAAARLREALVAAVNAHRAADSDWRAAAARLLTALGAGVDERSTAGGRWSEAVARLLESLGAGVDERGAADGRSSGAVARLSEAQVAAVNAHGTVGSDWNAVAARLRDVHVAVQEAVVGRREAANRETVEEARALWRMTICRAIMKLMGGMVQYRFSIEQKARLAA